MSMYQNAPWRAEDAHQVFTDPHDVKVVYDRARTIVRQAAMAIEDVENLSDRFWDFHRSGLAAADSAALTIVSIHWNLCMGTLALFRKDRPDLDSILKDLEAFRVCGEFMLTEVGHGLDARNIETTATYDGIGFTLHSPNKASAKAMPPTTPYAGIPRVAVVFAQLIANGKHCGVRPFVVSITESSRMAPGVRCAILPTRAGTTPVDHTITSFNHVRLPYSALLGPLYGENHDKRTSFISQIHRVAVGGLSLSLCNIPALKQCVYIATKYSKRRHVAGPGCTRVPIISFPTQSAPILTTFAHIAVHEQSSRLATHLFMDPTLSTPERMAISCVFKATITEATQRCLTELSERCGWQGLFTHNRIIELQLSLRGNSIAEGDVLVLCIRLASELLQNKYSLPPSLHPDSLLSRHEAGLLSSLQTKLRTLNSHNSPDFHRSDAYAHHILPSSRALIEAIGHRLAYEAALESGAVPAELLRLFELDCVRKDESWYVEVLGMSRETMSDMHVAALRDASANLEGYLEDVARGGGVEVELVDRTPLVSEEAWQRYLGALPVVGGEVGETGREVRGKEVLVSLEEKGGLSPVTTYTPTKESFREVGEGAVGVGRRSLRKRIVAWVGCGGRCG